MRARVLLPWTVLVGAAAFASLTIWLVAAGYICNTEFERHEANLHLLQGIALRVRDSGAAADPSRDEAALRAVALRAGDAKLDAKLRAAHAAVLRALELVHPQASAPVEPERAALAVLEASSAASELENAELARIAAMLRTHWRQLTWLAVLSCGLAFTVAALLLLRRRGAEERRRMAEELERLFDGAPIGIAAGDAAARLVRVNPAYCSQVGRSAAELLGTNGLELVHPDDRAKVIAELAHLRTGREREVQFEVRLLHKDGGTLHVAARVAVIRDRDGNVFRLISQIEDVTERRRSTVHLAEESKKLEAILAATSDGMALIDTTGRMLYMNKSLVETLSLGGLPRTTATAADIALRIRDSDPEPRDAFDRLFDCGPDSDDTLLPFPCSISGPRRRELLLSSTPIRSQQGQHIGRLAVVRDVTAETAARRAKDDLMASVSHELRTPLTAIRGFADLLRDERLGPLQERQRRALQSIAENSARLSLLVGDLLDVDRVENVPFDLELVDLAAVASEVVTAEQEIARQKGLELTLEGAGEAPVVADRDRLRQVLQNLVANAVKYTFSGTVRVRVLDLDAERVAVDVEDTGLGIDPADQQRIFEKFYRSADAAVRAQSGTGLGLSIVKVLVERHRGALEVDSAPGRGSRFRVLLPKTQGSSPVRLPRDRGARFGRRLALVIDDDPVAQRIVGATLRGLSLDVESALTGAAGLRLAAEHRPDVVVLDIGLPDIDGWEVIAHLRRDPALAAIGIVVSSGDDHGAKALRLGATSFLQKPVGARALCEEVERVLAAVKEPA